MTSRLLLAMVGAWLLASAFAWPHTSFQVVNTALMGLAVMVLALTSMRHEWARYASAGIAIWLLLSTFRFPTMSSATLWNNAAIAVIVFIGSMLGRDVAEIEAEPDHAFFRPPRHA
jgi:hypothetical protein